MGPRDWVVSRTNPEFLGYLANALRISRITAQLLVNRGITDPAQGGRFLRPTEKDLHEPLLLSDMDRAVDRIRKAVTARERIAVYGDYDVDGLTATAVLVEALGRLGATPIWHIPDRLKDGYGVTREALLRLSRAGATLIITVDCGISAVEEARYAAHLGMDMVITDHHHPGEILPEAAAVVNPRKTGERYPCPDLAGVGVAWKLAFALIGAEGAEDMLDLVALGTVADVVPLVGEHRWMVRRGIERIEAGLRPGLRALRTAARADHKRLGAPDLAFIFGPRINAAGRLGDAMPVVDLLTTRDEDKAQVLAGFLHRNNQIRQGIEQKVLDVAERNLEEEPQDGPLVLLGEDWHPGVLGIVAARLCDRIGRPVFLFSGTNGIARGSGRGPGGVHLVGALERCADLLREFGGHAQAAGVTVDLAQFARFRERFRDVYEEMRAGSETQNITRLESAVTLREIHPALLGEFAGLEPFGCGNEEPVLGARDVEVLGVDVLKNAHLRFRLRQQGITVVGMGFSKASAWNWVRQGDRVDLAFTPTEDGWAGRTAVKLRLRDIRPCS